jgi:ATP-dependent helicase/nuclease subunit A
MSTPRIIPDDVRKAQNTASDPAVSAWVAANAGSGKTHVLASRVIRLLLQDFDPAKILCITFTKAAAANMANRVFDDLRKWIALDDTALAQAMRNIGVGETGPAARARARRLFALALETPGGLKVQTIHAFCTSLLHLFPFEANVAAHFAVLDEASETQLLDQQTLKVLLEAAEAPEGPLGRALANAISTAADVTFRDMVRETIRARDRLERWIDGAGGVDSAISLLSQSLGIKPDDSDEKVNSDFFDQSLVKPSEWPAVAAALADGSKSDIEQSGRFAALAKLSETARMAAYIEIFCTKDLSPRKNIVTKAIRENNPELFQRLQAEQERVCALIARRRAIAARDRTAALIAIAHAVIARFRAEKDRRGLLDYDDLIDKTLALLNNVSAAWVHYKLDRGINHVLIDEAQDTSPKQWAIVGALAAEFFAGAGAHSGRRTIFAVGDEKQSIFSFQGAAPAQFEEMHRTFHTLSASISQEMHYARLAHSFRSGPNVLAAVDEVFKQRDVYTSVTTDEGGVPPHIALPEAAPGLVEIWDTEKPDEKREMEGWDAPFDEVSEANPQVRLARRIAAHVKRWQQQGRRPGEVLILVRRRGALFEAIIRALKNETIAVAGADRLVLTEHIAVMDLMVLADAVLLPDDDLALGTVLKSPLFGLDDDALFKLAWDRKGSLRAALRAQRPDLAARLDEIGADAQSKSPFAFYAELLGAGGGRRAFLARLGHEAADALDEFLNLALEYERGETPSLQSFVAWLRSAEAEVKRDMEMARDEVRVMTVHGAKGLEAPIVILADTTSQPQGWHPPRLLGLKPEHAAPGAPERLVWAGPKTGDVGLMAAARQSVLDDARNEYRRLLYVAMTRASDRLIVCGVDGSRKRPEGCWYDLVLGALEPDCVKEPADDGVGEVLRYRKTPDIAAAVGSTVETKTAAVAPPRWLRTKVAAGSVRAEPIKPSGFVDDPDAAELPRPSEARERALLRGNIVHRLLQSLPDIPPERRAEAARRYIARQKTDFSDAERDQIVAQVTTVLSDPRFAALFSSGSRAEVPIVGRVNGRTVTGVVDRLIVATDAILIADYKTNRPAPRSVAEIADRYQGYIRQLALYRAVLTKLYPGRPIRAALVWTDIAELVEIPAEALDAAVATLTSP